MVRPIVIAAALAAGLVASCATPGGVAPTVSPTREPEGVVYYARGHEAPLAVRVPIARLGPDGPARIRSLLETLRAAPRTGPAGSFNVVPLAIPALEAVSIRGDAAFLDFSVDERGWGLDAPAHAGAFLQQVVWTTTEQPPVARVRITQNGGDEASVAGIRMDRMLTRDSVLPPPPELGIVYFARDLEFPLPVFVEGAGSGTTPEERIASRLRALERGPSPVAPDAFNVLARMTARLAAVNVDGDLAVLDYAAPDGEWGLHGAATLRAFLEQAVYTATEEPGIRRVLITQNGGSLAVVGGEGLVIDGPIGRIDLAGTGPR